MKLIISNEEQMSVLNKLPLSKLSSLILDIFNVDVMEYKELIVSSLSKIPHVYIRNCEDTSKLVEEMFSKKMFPRSMSLKHHTIDSKISLDTAVLMRKLTNLVYNERSNPLKFKIK